MQERPWKILVADDNQQNLELLEAYLADVHCQVVAAVDGEDALAKIESEKPDLILLDVMMPKVSGFEICRQVKSNPATREIPVLMITSLHETADIERGVDAGADDFLSKPVHKQILLTRVRSLLKVRSLKSELERTLAYLQEVEAPRPDV
jgi:PleD family two-component response regulator